MSKNKQKLLFLVQLPPPIHGVAVVNKSIVDSKQLNEKYNIIVLPLNFVTNLETIGKVSLGKLFRFISIFFQLFKILIFKKIDLVYITISPIGFSFFRDSFYVFLMKLFRKKIVFHIHGKGINEELSSVWKKKWYQYTFKNVEVILLGDVLRNDIDSIYQGDPHILNNGISNEFFDDLEKVPKKEVTRFIFLTNLIKSKGIKIFLESLRMLNKDGRDFSATIVGGKGDLSEDEVNDFIQKNNLSKKVKALGPKYGIDKYKELYKSDVFVLPSYNDCYPLSILEAMKSGLCVISTDVGAIPEIIKDRQNGFIIRQKDTIELYKKMIFCIKNESVINKIKENNVKEYKEKYTIEVFLKGFETIMDNILAK